MAAGSLLAFFKGSTARATRATPSARDALCRTSGLFVAEVLEEFENREQRLAQGSLLT
jgi:hypothetical protein